MEYFGVYCPKCLQDSLPMRNGTCGWCDTRIATPAGVALPKRGPQIKPDDGQPCRWPQFKAVANYANRGCRCDRCRRANRDYQRERRRLKKAA